MKEYTTNPNKRCCLCKGREVIEFDRESKEEKTNLVKINASYYCKDKVECDQNREAESTILSFNPEGTKLKVTKHGNTVLEVDKSEQV